MRQASVRLFCLILVVVGLVALGCSGPPAPAPQAQVPATKAQPPVIVSNVRLTAPTTDDAPYRIEATISHNTPGGPAGISFRLRNRASGEIIQSNGQVQLAPGVALVAVGEVQAPRADYQPEVEVQYPPR